MIVPSISDSITGVVPEDRSGIWLVAAAEVLPTLCIDILEIRGAGNVVNASHVVMQMKRNIAPNDNNFMVLCYCYWGMWYYLILFCEWKKWRREERRDLEDEGLAICS